MLPVGDVGGSGGVRAGVSSGGVSNAEIAKTRIVSNAIATYHVRIWLLATAAVISVKLGRTTGASGMARPVEAGDDRSVRGPW
jgi:hypothetical protein